MSKIRYRKTIASCVALAAVALFFTLVVTHAGRAKPRPAPRPGDDGSTEVTRGAIKPGDYATAINIHNPSPVATATFYVKAVVDGGTPTKFQTATLGPDYAAEIDCTDIGNLLVTDSGLAVFTKGFVVIFAAGAVSPAAFLDPLPLDVVGVYTSEPPAVLIPIPYGTSGSGTQTKIPGIGLDMLTIAPRPEVVRPTTTVAPGQLPAGRYYEYSAKFLCGNTAGAT
jgi:hypothetical protein